MCEFGVNGAGQDFTADFSELCGFVAEGNDFGGTNKCKVEGVEKEENIFTFIVFDVDFPKIVLVPGCSTELRCRFSNE